MTKVKRIDKLLKARSKITKILDSDCSEDVEYKMHLQYIDVVNQLRKEMARIKQKTLKNINKKSYLAHYTR